jgi:hypothetical protein
MRQHRQAAGAFAEAVIRSVELIVQRVMSALPPKADMGGGQLDVRFVPILLQKSVAGFFGQ